jgi:hypothetical protein
MKMKGSEGLMNSTRAERNKGKIRIENRRMSHPIAPKGHQKQGDNENAPKGYRIVLFYRNRKGKSFDCSATDAERSSAWSWAILRTEKRKISSFYHPLPSSSTVLFDLLEEVCFLFGPFAFATIAVGKLSNVKSMPCSLMSLRANRIRNCGEGGNLEAKRNV